MSKRYVDADVLESLARDTRSYRGQISDELSRAQSRVNDAPHSQFDWGRWQGITGAFSLEFDQFDREERTMRQRAATTRIISVVTQLPGGMTLSLLRQLGLLGASLPALTLGELENLASRADSLAKSYLSNGGALPPAAVFLGGLLAGGGAAIGGGIAKLGSGGLGDNQAAPPTELKPGPTGTKPLPGTTGGSGGISEGANPLGAEFESWAGQFHQGETGGQCVEFAKMWATRLDGKGGAFAGGPNGTPQTEWDAWSRQDGRFTAPAWKQIQGAPFHKGDIVFFKAGPNGAPPSHVAVVSRDWDGTGDVYVTDSNSTNNLTIRLDHASGRPGDVLGVMRRTASATQNNTGN